MEMSKTLWREMGLVSVGRREWRELGKKDLWPI